MRIAAFTCGWNYTSARFRVRQYIPDLMAEGIDVREHIAPIYKHHEPRWNHPAWMGAIKVARPLALMPSVLSSHRHDASWIQKEMIWGRDSLERFTNGPRFLDVDDAIWAETARSETNMARLAGRVDVVMAGNDRIAEWFAPHARSVRIIPTAVDVDSYTPAADENLERPFTIVWTGQKVTTQHLQVAEAALAEFMTRHRDVRFQSISDADPQLGSLPVDRVTWYPWSPDIEVAHLQDADVGIMPLIDNENGRAKCAFKMLQYMSCGIPTVVTPIGLNRDLLAAGDVGFGASTVAEWVDAFEQLYQDRDAARMMGREGRRVVVEQYSRSTIARRIADVFREVGGE